MLNQKGIIDVCWTKVSQIKLNYWDHQSHVFFTIQCILSLFLKGLFGTSYVQRMDRKEIKGEASIKDLAKAPSKAPSRALIKTWAQGWTLPVGNLALSTMEGDCQIPWLPRWLKFTFLHTAEIANKRMTKLLTKPGWAQVGSPEMCQSLCQARTGCLFFTWVGPTSDVEFYRFHVNV